jgi:hypothetical protein
LEGCDTRRYNCQLNEHRTTVAMFCSGRSASHRRACGNRLRATGAGGHNAAVIGADRSAASTPNYLRSCRQKLDIVGVHAPDAAVASKWAGREARRSPTPRDDREDEAGFVVARTPGHAGGFRFGETGIPPDGALGTDANRQRLADLRIEAGVGRGACRSATAV